MQGNAQLIEKLNGLLADELTMINQYMVHAEMCENWGYETLGTAIKQRARDEMRHAESLIERILFLEGMPIVSNLKQVKIGGAVADQHRNDKVSEEGAIGAYNEAIALAAQVHDNGTREMLETILKDEERHIDWIDMQIDQIKQMGIENYLSMQTK